jgi:ribonuclease P protein component
LPREYRLRSPEDFRRVLKSGRRKTDALFTLVSLPGSGPDARLGIAVSRKVSKSAVERNRIKRVVRDNFRHRRAGLPAMDIVVMARPAAAQAERRDIAESLERHFDRIERTCAGSHSS